MSALMSSYGRLPVAIERGEGVWVWDTDGKRYMDALGGIAVCALGHAHPGVTAAISRQAGTLLHCSNLYHIPIQEELGAVLCDISGMDKVFFCNSGAEANEACIKIARLHGNRKFAQAGGAGASVVAMQDSFHGRTMATLTATGNRKIHAGFEPLVPGFTRAPFSDLDALHRIASGTTPVSAVMLEPIQGEGGIRTADQGYLRGVRELCDEHGWLMMVDEVQTGIGRTGRWFAHQHEDILPDVMAVAKALGNGVPIGACLARGDAAELIQPGSHGTTFGGNPLSCSAGLAVIEEIRSRDLLKRAAELGDRIKDGMRTLLGERSGVVSIRGQGLMLGIELDRDCGDLVKQALDAGFLINVTAGRVVRMLPPYILTDAEADQLIEGVGGLIASFLDQATENPGT